MGVFEMVVAIVLITVIGGLVRTQMKTRSGSTAAPDQDSRIKKLEDRVRALEDVVGDQSYELKEKLRELER